MAKKRSGDKRERILQAATRVFAQNGFYDTRVSEIAKAAGVADGTIYLYFENKDHVLVSIFEDRITKLVELLEKVAAEDLPVTQRLAKLIILQLGLVKEERDLAEVITVNLRQSSRLLKQYAAPLFVRYLEVVANMIRDAQEAGEVRSDVHPMVVARALYGALDGLLMTWTLSPESEATPQKLQKAAAQFAQMFLEGVIAREPT